MPKRAILNSCCLLSKILMPANLFSCSKPALAKARAVPTISPEDAILDQLYKAVLAEGGELVVYAGGDGAHFYNATKAAFSARFSVIYLTIKVDLSKYHVLHRRSAKSQSGFELSEGMFVGRRFCWV